jgi:hypothetical protein
MKTTNSLERLSKEFIKPKKVYMKVNVILTFDSNDKWGGSQEIFDLSLPLGKMDKNPIKFIHQKLFKRIANKCPLLNREVEDLIKISTSSNWDLFSEITGHESLPDLGHSCKWYFGNGRSDLDPWEKALMRDFGFGTNANMSYIDRNWIEATKAMIAAQESSLSQNNTSLKPEAHSC